jgi:hypothetical protein
MAKKETTTPVSKMTVKKPRKTAIKVYEASTPPQAPKAEAPKPASTAVEVYDHVAKKELKMGKRQYEILSKTTYTEGRSKFLRYTLGNVKKAAITKND